MLSVNDNEIKENEKSSHNYCTIYSDTYIGCKKNGTVFKNPSITTIYDNALVDKKIIREYMNFEPNAGALENIITVVDYVTEYQNEIKFNRIKKVSKKGRATTRVEIELKYSITKMRAILKNGEHNTLVKYITPAEAFDYEQDLSNSILNVSEEEAIQRDGDFLYSWILFNNPEQNFTDNQKALIKLNPLLFLSNTTLIAS